jgi:integrase
MSRYLRREADSFVFRRRVPALIQNRLGLKEIYRSLKTTVRRTAKARAAHLFIATERLFQVIAEDDETLSHEDIQAAVRHWLGTSHVWRQRLDGYLKSLSPGSLRHYHERLPDILLDMGMHEHISSEANLVEEAWAALEYSDYAGWGSGETLKRTKSVFRKVLKEYVDQRMQEVFEPGSLAGTTGHSAPITTAPANMSKVSTFIEAWQIDLRKGYDGHEGRAPTTAAPYQTDVELFIGLMGDLPVGKITYDIAADFRTKLLNLPSNHGKSRTGSLKQELVLAKANKTTPRMTMKTVKRHFSGLSSIWRWLVYKKHVPAKVDPFHGHSFPGTKSKKSARDTWAMEDMQCLFSSLDYRQANRHSALHWLPLISLYSGMRLEEICRLRPHNDIAVKDGIYSFIIQKREDWDPKTEAGARVVPVHSWLLSHGFKIFAQDMKARNAAHLFPELNLDSKKNKLSTEFSRDFSRMKIALGVSKKTAFHSFRHTFRTALESTDHKESHIDAVMGHEGGKGEGRVYTKGVSVIKLKEVVESFAPTANLDDLVTLASTPQAQTLQSLKPKIRKIKLVPPVFDASGRQIKGKK